ncbi:MAG TPA: YceI family protein [Planctomycetota bacterium]|nr:YceI family protein [Planctomycetota bacterium]
MKTLLLLPVTLVLLALTELALTEHDRSAVLPLGEHDWVVDPVHSSVVFRVKHANASWFQGTFDKISGEVSLDPANAAAGKVALTIPVDSIDTNDGKRDAHLAGPDFFNAKENPSIVFTSTKIAKKSDTMLDVTGELAMAGKKKSITLSVEKTGEGEFMGKRVGWMTTFTIKRSDFGMTYGVDKNVLGDDVTLMIALETAQPKK